MSDKTYQPKTYRKQGGDEFVIASGGKLTIEAGGKIIDGSGTAAGAGLSPLIWSDCPVMQLLADPTLGVINRDDFSQVMVTGFPYLITGINGTFLAVPNVPYGQAQLLATGADNDAAIVTSNNNIAGLIKANAASAWWFEARVQVSQITLAQGVFVGLVKETGIGTDFMTANTMALKVQNFLGFQIISATDIAAVWQAVMCLDAGARVAIAAAAATASVNFVKLGMKSVPNAAGTVATVTFYVDGVAVATTVLSSATNFPLDKVMQITFATKCGQATANSLTLDWWQAAQLR
jgi:hypothetical protein